MEGSGCEDGRAEGVNLMGESAVLQNTESRTMAWRRVQPGLWVATDREGRALGIVSERWTRGFAVTSASGRDLGRHATLDDAKAVLEEWVVS